MHVQIAPDHMGNARREFDPADATAVAAAEARFRELTIRGFRAVAPRPNGDAGKIVRDFAPMAEQVLIIPRLQGG